MELKNYDKEERFDPATVEALKGQYCVCWAKTPHAKGC